MEHASNKEIYSVQATVRTYESGANGLMKPETVLHWFQEIAEAHASCLGFGYDFVTSRSLAWVEVRMDAAVSRLPRWKETVELRTWTARKRLCWRAATWKSGMPKATASLQQAVCGLSLTYAAGVLCH